MTTNSPPTYWGVPRAYRAAFGLSTALAIWGLLFHRFDLALMAMPLLLATFMSRNLLPTDRTIGKFVAQPDSQTAFSLQMPESMNVDAKQLRVYAQGYRPTILVTNRDQVDLVLNTKRTGPQPTFTVHGRGIGVFGLLVENPWIVTADETFGLPNSYPLGQMPAPTRLRGLTGARQSRRIGDGGDLRDIAPMRPGDSLRRVNWRATGRRSPDLTQLYVRRTFANAEGIAELVIDSRDDVGPDIETWLGSAPLRVDDLTSLDLARHAAASVAGALIGAGDRVGLEDLAYQKRPVAAATGQRQLRRIQQALALSAPHGEPTEVVRPPRLPNDAVIYLFSTLLDDSPVSLATGWVDQGNPVIVVNTLPKVRTGRRAKLALAWRIAALEREQRIANLKSRAIPVVDWQTADSIIPSAELTKIARMQAKQRGRR